MMREQGGGGLTMKVMVMVMVVMVNEIIAKPTSITPQHHEVNHVQDHYLDDALGNWLNNFGTYTFMVKQGLDTPADEGEEEGGEEGGEFNMEGAIQEAEEELRKEVEGEWSAPIAVSMGSQRLLDPRHDYLVTVESLVAEEGSIFLTLSKYENQTTCGVGGVTLEEEEKVRQGGESNAAASSLHLKQDSGNNGDTFVAIDIQNKGNTTSSKDLSKWVSVSEQYWWARGQLSGGGILSITFTPPECGCLSLSTYFALPVGNMTLVVGPQAYPEQLQKLICIDPLTPIHDHEHNDDEEEEEKVHIIQPSALVSRDHEVESESEDAETKSTEEGQDSTKTKLEKGGKRMMKKKRRQMRRQRIRQAGRQARQQGIECENKKDCRRMNRKKNHRNNTKLWEKLRKRERKARRRNSDGKHHHHQEGNETSDDMMEHSGNHHDNTTDHHEERVVDILLRGMFPDNATHEEEAEEEEPEESTVMEESEHTGSENEGMKGEEKMTPRQRRKNRKQRRKMMRKQKKKVYPSGVKFCCKQGVKHKKNTFELDSAPENITATCDMSIDVVATFANHQFGTEQDVCTNTFMTCCLGFTEEMWDGIKARKVARKSERKQRRKQKRQGRKQKRKQERRQRKNRKHSHQHHEEPEEPTEEVDAEGINHVQTE